MGLILFYAAATLTLFASFGVVATRNIVHAALFLLAALAGVAGLFVLLYAEFLALVQLLIYGGAIIIVI
ncbi:MAG: NADH-quinone oxidoreductase subunit J, partial [Chloroflexi bacterium]|nr:NADH-quinone oxidoreductase subunit J [Chloroflexota bacterium]